MSPFITPSRTFNIVTHLSQGQQADPEVRRSGVIAPESTAPIVSMRPNSNPLVART